MGQRGPKPKPKALRLLEGNPGRLEILPDEYDVTPDLPAVKPIEVALEEASSAEWDRLAAAMPPHLYTAADVAVLSLYTESWAMLWKAKAEIDAYGLLIEERTEKHHDDGTSTVSVKYKKNPAVATWVAAAEKLLQTTDRLGLNPSVRARLAVPKRGEKPQPASKFSGLIRGK